MNFKKTETTSSIFSNLHHMKLEMNYRKKTGKFTNIQRLNNQWFKEQLKAEIKKLLEETKMEVQHTKTYSLQEKQFSEGSL